MSVISYRGEIVGIEFFGLKIYWKTYDRYGYIPRSPIYVKGG